MAGVISLGQDPVLTISPIPPATALAQTNAPLAFDYAVIGLFFIVLAAAYFVATKIVPAPKSVTAKKI